MHLSGLPSIAQSAEEGKTSLPSFCPHLFASFRVFCDHFSRSEGLFRGTHLVAALGRQFCVFRGYQFAFSTSGSLRSLRSFAAAHFPAPLANFPASRKSVHASRFTFHDSPLASEFYGKKRHSRPATIGCGGSKTHKRPVSIGLWRVYCHVAAAVAGSTSKNPNVYAVCGAVAGPKGGLFPPRTLTPADIEKYPLDQIAPPRIRWLPPSPPPATRARCPSG